MFATMLCALVGLFAMCVKMYFKSIAACRKLLSTGVQNLCCLVFLWKGPMSGFTPGMPETACCSLPLMDIMSFVFTAFAVFTFCVKSFSFVILLAGRVMHLLMPSNTHPRISLTGSHAPLVRILVWCTESWLLWPDHSGGGKIKCMRWSNARDKWRSLSGSVVCAACMKLSTKISMRCAKSCLLILLVGGSQSGPHGLPYVGLVGSSSGISSGSSASVWPSILYSGKEPMGREATLSDTLPAVLVPMQK